MSPQQPFKAEWHGRPDFAEVAEALGVPTDRIMAAMNPDADHVHVLYTPDEFTGDYAQTHIWGASLGRDAAGVLVVMQVRDTGQTFADYEQFIEGRLRDKFGEPDE